MQKLAILAFVAFVAFASAIDDNGDCVDDITDVPMCPANAECVNTTKLAPHDGAHSAVCECMPGTVAVNSSGSATCQTHSWAARYVIEDMLDESKTIPVPVTRRSNPSTWTRDDVESAGLCPTVTATGDVSTDVATFSEWGFFLDHNDVVPDEDTYLTRGMSYTAVYCLYRTQDAAETAMTTLRGGIAGSAYTVTVPAEVYAFTLPTTSNPLFIPPTGLTVDTVWFNPTCQESGCWVVEGLLTTGSNVWKNNAFNSFYIPRAVGSDELSYDFNYPDTVDATFQVVNHPCTSADYDADEGLTQKVTTCCILADDGFLARYRPTQNFADWATMALTKCAATDFADAEIINRPQLDMNNISFPASPLTFLNGYFMDMTNSTVTYLNVTDPYFGQYKYTMELDEVELRNKAGILIGTVGVEHTIDTFLGLTNFRTTGIQALDTFSTQIAIHLEKTSFFTVSTEGVNQYTFLEYVNLRLVAVYQQDKDFSGTNESATRTVRTDSSNQANYVQVTFTLGSQYKVDEDPTSFPLIPSDSVRAGFGTFFAEDLSTLHHMCTSWEQDTFDDTSPNTYAQDTFTVDWFNASLQQECAPKAAMCVSPASIPDSFVVYNIPLGKDYFEQAGGPSTTLSNNIFVDMVISAVEHTTGTPNEGDAPEQIKTTLTASIPIVEGGVNIFCDGFTAKTDLNDVANADIVVGSASNADELTRLRIKKDITTTQMDSQDPTAIDSDSIEAGLMTLVLKGNNSYFLANTGRDEVTIELEDVITIHIMESDGSGETTDKSDTVTTLLATAGADNLDSNGLDVDGYPLNGAFYFEIDRASQRAHLEPSQALLTACPFNPPRPSPGATYLETCVIRRDVRFRGYPARTGAYSSAMELCVNGVTAGGGVMGCPTADQTDSLESDFFTTILGNNEYAKKLGSNYARVIAAEYELNNRYRRAYFINPGYEWTPTQTGGTPIFSVSQKLFMFALITLDENLVTATGAAAPPLDLPSYRRRMLLQSVPSNVDEALQDRESSVGGGVFEFQTTPSQMMAKAFDVPQDRVATFTVQLQLTQAEACMSDTELQGSIRATMEDYLLGTASPFHTVQITKMAVSKAGVQCTRRSIRSLLSSFTDATAEVTMLIVFEEGQDSIISLEKLQSMAGIESVTPLSVSPKVTVNAPADYVPPPPTGSFKNGGAATEESSSSNVAIIAGAAAGGAVVLIAGIVGFMFMRKRQSNDREVISAVQTINVEDLKHQLANDA